MLTDARTARRRDVLIVLVLSAATFAASLLVCADAASRRAHDLEASAVRSAWVRATGLADPLLSSSSRWLRHPSLTEPGAALTESPDGLDVDPAGLAIEGFDGAREPRTLVRIGSEGP